VAHCECGGKLARIHRTFRQKLVYMAIYRCRDCGRLKARQRRFMFYFAKENTCPLCGTRRLRRLNEPDHIDRMHWNLFKPFRRWMDVRIYHCRYCRIQFYDLVRSQAHPAARQGEETG
jgi:hypothetical protein